MRMLISWSMAQLAEGHRGSSFGTDEGTNRTEVERAGSWGVKCACAKKAPVATSRRSMAHRTTLIRVRRTGRGIADGRRKSGRVATKAGSSGAAHHRIDDDEWRCVVTRGGAQSGVDVINETWQAP
jgi:hypothetical protein